MSALSSSMMTLLGVALRRTPGLHGDATIPELRVSRTLTPDATWLRDYRRVIGAVDNGTLPPCAPQVMAIGLHLELLKNPAFPLPALGMVHIENTIDEQAAITDTATIELTASVSGHRPHDKGVAFDIVTEVRVDGTIPWRSVMTALVRTKTAVRASTTPRPPDDIVKGKAQVLSSSVLRVPADMGRRYASVAGDANPIHLTALTAKAFGFPRAIAHGMWTLARSLSEVHDLLPPQPRRIAVRFIRPVLLPSTIVVDAARLPDSEAGGLALSVTPERAGPPHIKGRITTLS